MGEPAEHEKSRRPGAWGPGQSGNPAGSSRLVRERRALTEALRNAITPERARAVVDALIARAEDGDTRAAEMVFDRLDGPVKREVEISGALSLSDACAAFTEDLEDGIAEATGE